MTYSPGRAGFLRGDFRPAPGIRPPWALPEADFVARCDSCGRCIGACPERILTRGRGGFPKVDFSASECTFCGRCAKACARGALKYALDREPWALKADIAPDCLAWRNVVCRTCRESCQEDAIRFKLAIGAAARPQVDPDRCTGCGACVGPCPVAAVTVGEIAAKAAARVFYKEDFLPGGSK